MGMNLKNSKEVEEEIARLQKLLNEAISSKESTIRRISIDIEPKLTRECTRCIQVKALYEKELKKDSEKAGALQALRERARHTQKELQEILSNLGVSTQK